jgi:protein involved in polysaccharide export with SLBB domain
VDSIQIVRFLAADRLDTLYVSADSTKSEKELDTELRADDRVFVRPQSEWRPARQVTILGEVRFPGTYAIDEGHQRVSDLLRWAGGFTAAAARRNVRLERRPVEAEPDVEFDRLSRLSRGEMTNSEYQTYRSKLSVRQSAYLVDCSSGTPQPPGTDVLLRDGDRMIVGRLELAVRVDGSVRSPGLVTFEEGRSVGDYIQLAGGLARRANLDDARVTRSGSNHTIMARDVRQIEAGDYIWIPEKKDTSFWSTFKDVMAVAGQTAAIILLIDQVTRHP